MLIQFGSLLNGLQNYLNKCKVIKTHNLLLSPGSENLFSHFLVNIIYYFAFLKIEVSALGYLLTLATNF